MARYLVIGTKRDAETRSGTVWTDAFGPVQAGNKTTRMFSLAELANGSWALRIDRENDDKRLTGLERADLRSPVDLAVKVPA